MKHSYSYTDGYIAMYVSIAMTCCIFIQSNHRQIILLVKFQFIYQPNTLYTCQQGVPYHLSISLGLQSSMSLFCEPNSHPTTLCFFSSSFYQVIFFHTKVVTMT